jgi:hypothetical protein
MVNQGKITGNSKKTDWVQASGPDRSEDASQHHDSQEPSLQAREMALMNRKIMTAPAPRSRPKRKRTRPNAPLAAHAHAQSNASRVKPSLKLKLKLKSKGAPKTQAASVSPDWRPDKIRRAKRLLENANYPSEEVIESVANLLSRGLRKQRNLSAQSAG